MQLEGEQQDEDEENPDDVEDPESSEYSSDYDSDSERMAAIGDDDYEPSDIDMDEDALPR